MSELFHRVFYDPSLKINRNQRRRWKKNQMLPCQVIRVFWDQGVTITEERPSKGIELHRFIEMFEGFVARYRGVNLNKKAKEIYKNIIDAAELHEKKLLKEMWRDWKKMKKQRKLRLR